MACGAGKGRELLGLPRRDSWTSPRSGVVPQSVRAPCGVGVLPRAPGASGFWALGRGGGLSRLTINTTKTGCDERRVDMRDRNLDLLTYTREPYASSYKLADVAKHFNDSGDDSALKIDLPYRRMFELLDSRTPTTSGR